ncbi:Not1 N-terminal domain, CCR4-Not complex component-domain-containing protein [Parasitella parasitica]|nr:Not1 N-terminal domain, CCR4-Not complex component-domain-containing protein [Parasitella parasitica]
MSMKKLQAEIDRLLKKVSEGLETFESIFDKIHHTNNANQKDKYEQDLKKEIKKLQRLRDQIKTWLSSNDIKDKRALLENRKLIEAQMERFKQTEKEIKTKAYSKEGLMQKERLDPKEKEKVDACEFLTNAVDELSRQIEHEEFEIEQLESFKRGNKKADNQRVERLHKMEGLNERRRFHINRLELILRLLENDQLEPDRVNEFKDAIQYYVECNQEPDFEEDEGLYDELDLEKEEELYAIRTDEFHNKSDSEVENEDHVQYSSLSTPAHSPKKSTKSSPKSLQDEVEASAVKSTSTRDASSSTLSSNYAQSLSPSNKSSDKASAWNEPPKIIDQSKPSSSSSATDKRELLSSPYSNSSTDDKDPKLPASLADLAPSFELVKNKNTPDLQYTNQMLDASFQHVPDLIDSERLKLYQPRNPFSNPSYYPQQPLVIFDNPVLYEKFDMDTLFYIFYYQQGTYQQYLAAKELKKQSWRFHKKYLTWFQRHEEPKIITEDYEQGTYIYFDYEGAWCQRKKTDFRFEYRYLEEA